MASRRVDTHKHVPQLLTENFMVATSFRGRIDYSYNGIDWIVSVPEETMFGQLKTIAWNGSLWVAGGMRESAGVLAYSSDGILWKLATPGFVMFSICNTVAWNGEMWVAGGEGEKLFVYSYDGMNWSYLTYVDPVFTVCYSLAWNGSVWVAGGSGSSNSLATSTDGKTWKAVVHSIGFLAACVCVAWNGSMFVAGGTISAGGDIALLYSYNGTDWNLTYTPNLFETCYAVAWNGSMWVAGGAYNNQSALAHSEDGLYWTNAESSLPGTLVTSIAWNGSMWVATGEYTDSILYYSYNGDTWNSLNVCSFEHTTAIASRRVMPYVGAQVILNLSTIVDWFLNGIPTPTTTMNPGDTTTENPTTIGLPEYKTTTQRPSDQRVKMNITDANTLVCLSTIESLPLRYFEWTDEFARNTGRVDKHELGFIAQEASSFFPKSVSLTSNQYADDFHSLNTDQIYKAHIGATKQLLSIVYAQQSTIQFLMEERRCQQSTLDSIIQTL
jgi:hypothetical protein